jgi:predicted Zn-dependent protease
VLRDEIVIWRSDARLWDLLSQAQAKLGLRAEAHRTAAERYVLLGSPLMAVEQLRLAQRAGDTDFYTASVIDARLRELEPEARREIEDSRQGMR